MNTKFCPDIHRKNVLKTHILFQSSQLITCTTSFFFMPNQTISMRTNTSNNLKKKIAVFPICQICLERNVDLG